MHDPGLAKEALAELPPDIEHSPLYNPDLAPVPKARRNWSTYNFAALWISMAHCIPTYMLAGGLIAVGMNWWQALLTITLGNIIVLVPILLNAHPGTEYGIPFPVLARAAFGTRGANVPAVLRGIVACGWFGIQTYIGGEAVKTFLEALWPAYGTLGGDFSQAFGINSWGQIVGWSSTADGVFRGALWQDGANLHGARQILTSFWRKPRMHAAVGSFWELGNTVPADVARTYAGMIQASR